MREKLYFAAAFLLLSVPLAAQAPPSGVGIAGPTYWVGGAISWFNPDYGCGGDGPFHCWNQQLIGVVPYMDTSSFIWHRVGVEAEARMMIFHSPFDQVQTSYLGGHAGADLPSQQFSFYRQVPDRLRPPGR
jgi:hypothetical protein